MISTISANELKTKGVSSIEKQINEDGRVLISVRGKDKYVVLSLDEYNKFRDTELATYIKNAKNDIKENRFHTSIDEHIQNITNV